MQHRLPLPQVIILKILLEDTVQLLQIFPKLSLDDSADQKRCRRVPLAHPIYVE